MVVVSVVVILTCAFVVSAVAIIAHDFLRGDYLTVVTTEDLMSDYSIVRVHVEETKLAVVSATANAQALSVTDEDSFALAQGVIKEVKRRAKELEERKEAYMKPLRELLNLVREDTKPVLDAADAVERILKGKCLAYRQEVTRLRAEAEAKARALVAAQAPAPEQRAALTAVAVAVAPKTAGVSFRKSKRGRIVDATKVPPKYWVHSISQAAIDFDVANGVTEIEGVVIEEFETMAVRT